MSQRGAKERAHHASLMGSNPFTLPRVAALARQKSESTNGHARGRAGLGRHNRQVNANAGTPTTRKTEIIPTDPVTWSGSDRRHRPRRLRRLPNHGGVKLNRAAVLRIMTAREAEQDSNALIAACKLCGPE